MVKLLSEYTEYLIEYDTEALVVYISGLDSDLYWDEIKVETDVNNPEEFALGIQAGLALKGIFSTVTKVVYETD